MASGLHDELKSRGNLCKVGLNASLAPLPYFSPNLGRVHELPHMLHAAAQRQQLPVRLRLLRVHRNQQVKQLERCSGLPVACRATYR